MAEMRLAMNYFAKFDGKVKWEDVEPIVEATYHPEMVVVTGTGEMKRDDFKNSVQQFTNKGGSIEVLKIEKIPDGVRYELIFHNPDGTTNYTKTQAVFKDGQVYHVQPDDPLVYSKVLDEEPNLIYSPS